MTLLSAVLAIAIFQASPPSQNGDAQLIFKFEDPELQPSNYSMEINQDGSGHYRSAPGTIPSSDEGTTSSPLDRPIKIADPLLSEFFRTARTHRLFATECDYSKGHIAFTGKKTLRYTGPEGQGECTFNYANDRVINELAADLMAISYTLEEGSILALDHQHSRLSLDAELEALLDAAKDGRALEIQNIAPELQSIVDDESVMIRARSRARALLNLATSKH